MNRTNIVIHLPSYRSRALQLQKNTAESAAAYDGNIGAYLAFLRQQAEQQGYSITTDQRDTGATFSIEETDHQAKKDAHAWLESRPDIWNWIP